MGRVTKSTKITGRQLLAIAYLTQGLAPKDVAQKMGVDVGTIYSWQKNPAFQERLSQHIESVANQELDRGLEEAQMNLHQSAPSIVAWMTDVILGRTELKDKTRWRMALDLLHHAGIVDRQSILKAQQSSQAAQPNVNLTLDQRRQQVLLQGNEEVRQRLIAFTPPNQE